MDKILEIIWERKLVFLGTFFLVFIFSYIILVALDFLPEAPAVDDEPVAAIQVDETESGPVAVTEEVEPLEPVPETTTEPTVAVENLVEEPVVMNSNTAVDINAAEVLPIKISIARLDKVITVLNPDSRTIADLDTALLNGVVRHPDSATLSQEGNVFILGHSSYLPHVINKNFQAFNGIQNLEWGDTIELFTENTVYEYRVEKVYRAQAQDVTVPIAGTGNMLTLATCNSFGSVDDRYIVEAKRVSVHNI